MDPTEILLGAALAAIVLVVVVVWLRAHRRREARDRQAAARAIADQLHLPPSLHPVIDADICIGSLACIQACPEGDILGIVDGVAKLIIGSNCIGHGRCAEECPVGAIKLVFGTSERGVDLPEVNERFESSRLGVHVVGELGGMGLIKNAITQGLQLADHLAARLRPRDDGVPDVAIVGAGPAGLATAVGLRARGLSFRLLEQGRFGGTIAHYPRHKIVMTERVRLPIFGAFGKKLMSKEQLLATWRKVADKAHLRVEEGVTVTSVGGSDGAFTLETSRGPVAARKVVLAIGRRGSPRALGVPGEELPKVTYSLSDPEQYAGARALVVGGGDSALEAAMALSDMAGEVALAYRGKSFGRCREANRLRIAELAREGRVHLLLESTVKSVAPHEVVLDTPGGSMTLPNDYVLACLGGDLPTAFLERAGVALTRHHGEVAHAPRAPRTRAHKHQDPSSRLGWVLLGVGVAIIAGLAAVGGEYYLLGRAARLRSPHHAWLKPSGLWGHGVGIVATLFMLSNFLYAARKRVGWLKGVASIKSWLTWHMFVGFMSPVAILFHTAFQSNNLIASSTYLSLLVVVGTGMIGRYIYGFVPGAGGSTPELSVLRAQLERTRREAGEHAWPDNLRQLVERAAAPPPEGGSLLLSLLAQPLVRVRDRLVLARARRQLADDVEYQELRLLLGDVERLRLQVGFYRGLKRLLSAWRVFHVVLAVVLVVVMTAHIGISLYLGYRWIFR